MFISESGEIPTHRRYSIILPDFSFELTEFGGIIKDIPALQRFPVIRKQYTNGTPAFPSTDLFLRSGQKELPEISGQMTAKLFTMYASLCAWICLSSIPAI